MIWGDVICWIVHDNLLKIAVAFYPPRWKCAFIALFLKCNISLSFSFKHQEVRRGWCERKSQRDKEERKGERRQRIRARSQYDWPTTVVRDDSFWGEQEMGGYCFLWFFSLLSFLRHHQSWPVYGLFFSIECIRRFVSSIMILFAMIAVLVQQQLMYSNSIFKVNMQSIVTGSARFSPFPANHRNAYSAASSSICPRAYVHNSLFTISRS